MKNLPRLAGLLGLLLPSQITAQIEENPADQTAERTVGTFLALDMLGDVRTVYDSDGDGWDDLWLSLFPEIQHTDKSFDTDGDGTSDYQEMLLWRDPIVAGPPPVKLTPAQEAAASRQANAELLLAAEEGAERLAAEAAAAPESYVQGFDGSAPDPDFIRPDNTEWQERMQTEIAQAQADASAVQTELERVAAKFGIGLTGIDEDGRSWMLAGEQNERPVFMRNENAIAANTINADDLWPGLTPTTPFFPWQDLTKTRNLTGAGLISAIFDIDGRALLTHQELAGHVTNFSTGTPSNHSTAIADIIAGAGVLDVINGGVNQGKLLKGLAYGSSVHSYSILKYREWLESEISAGTKFSNHSFALISGWEKLRIGSKVYWLWSYPNFTEDPRLGALPANTPGRVTIAWTDLSDNRGAELGTELDNPSRELVNDVDLQLQASKAVKSITLGS